MSRTLQPHRLSLLALAQSGQPLAGQTPVSEFERLAADAAPDATTPQPVAWQARAEFRAQPGAGDQLWLHLHAQAQLPLVCQRCLGPAVQSLSVGRWFRFVDSEAIAEAQDDDCEEDLLVLEPQFDLLALLEDELLMAQPLVPMHDTCPHAPVLSAGDEVPAEPAPHPFAALAQLKKKPQA